MIELDTTVPRQSGLAFVQVIDNFAVYNADGFMSTLELLPMWQHVDPDVDLFGSGIISQLDEDDSEWCTGHALNNLSTSLQCLQVSHAMLLCLLMALFACP